MIESRPGKQRLWPLFAMLLLYGTARLCQLWADRLPTLAIVLLHVVPPAVFALLHGYRIYGARGIAVFCSLCLGFGALAESLSLRTGFPFGHYYFTDVMGPKVLGLPLLLVLAYLGIGYVAWIVALLVLDRFNRPPATKQTVYVSLLASLVMVSWDLAMDPDWSTLDHAWIWRNGGAYFGVPISNYLGWSLTTFCIYLSFALYLRRASLPHTPSERSLWALPVAMYAICALGNLLLFFKPMAPSVVVDASGKFWRTTDVLSACAAVSVFLMLPFAVIAAWRLHSRSPKMQR